MIISIPVKVPCIKKKYINIWVRANLKRLYNINLTDAELNPTTSGERKAYIHKRGIEIRADE